VNVSQLRLRSGKFDDDDDDDDDDDNDCQGFMTSGPFRTRYRNQELSLISVLGYFLLVVTS